MPSDQNLRKIFDEFPEPPKLEDAPCNLVAGHPALDRLRAIISGEGEVLDRLSAAAAVAGPGLLSTQPQFLDALEAELGGAFAAKVQKELRRSLNAVVHQTRFGRNDPVFMQASVALLLLDGTPPCGHPLLLRLFADAVAGLNPSGVRGTDAGFDLTRCAILEVYSAKKRMEYARKPPAELVDELWTSGGSPPGELMDALVSLGDETAALIHDRGVLLLADLAREEGPAEDCDVGPACAILGERGSPGLQDMLLRGLRHDLTDQAAVAVARLGSGALPPLRDILGDPGEDPEARVQAVTAMTYMAHLHPDTREDVVAGFRACLLGAEEGDGEVCAWVVSGLGALGASYSCREEIRKVCEEGFLDQEDISFQDALNGGPGWLNVDEAEEDALERYRYRDEEWLRDLSMEQVERVLSRLPGLPGPVRVGEKVGRNDSCPCGSGRKYKRCCGQRKAFPPSTVD